MANSLSKLNIIVKYDAGYIYGIYHQDNLKYIGSTIDFKKRMWKHKYSCYNVKSKKRNLRIYQYIRANGVWEDYNFKIIDVYYSITKKILNNIEGEYMKHFGLNNLMNCHVPGRTEPEWREYNKVKLKNQYIKWYENNKVNVRNTGIIYREKNKVIIKQRKKEYRQKNKDKIKAHASKSWTCDICNSTITIGKKSRHLKGTRHLNKANEIN